MLIQTNNPAVIPMLYPWIKKYLAKIAPEYHTHEIAYLLGAFKKGSSIKLFVAPGHGYVLLSEEPYKNGLYGLQISVDNAEQAAEDIRGIAKGMGYSEVYWSSSRDPKAWCRLTGGEIDSYILKMEALKCGE